KITEIDARAGALRPAGRLGDDELVAATAEGRVLLRGDSFARLYDTRSGHEIRRAAGEVETVTKGGAVYIYSESAGRVTPGAVSATTKPPPPVRVRELTT